MNKHFHSLRIIGLALLSGMMSYVSANAATHQMERLERGVVAVKTTGGVFVSWRFLGTDQSSTSFNLYRDGTLVNSSPLTSVTNYTDANGTVSSTYTVRAVNNGTESNDSKSASVWSDIAQSIQLDLPAGGTDLGGTAYTYTPNDMSVGDLDGDGEYELIVKWDPSDSQDNSKSGYTGNVYLDAYELDGTKLWRINLGQNIRAGAHYTQFIVYDLDGDGKAEVACRTAPGTVDGKGNNVLMNSDKATDDYRNTSGYVISGPEYLTVFNGETGANDCTIAFEPARGNVSDWGDSWGNRVDRFLACVAYLDGVHPSLIMSRGYYARAGMAAYNYSDGKLTKLWSRLDTSDGTGIFGEGFHNLSVADIDDDGYDEIIFGSTAVDHNGGICHHTGLGHGDAQHVSKMCATCSDYYGWFVHEEKTSPKAYELRNLKTGKILWGDSLGVDNGRGLAADIVASNPGFEFWSSGTGSKVYDINGNVLSDVTVPTGVGGQLAINFRIYWDGDLQDELLDRNLIMKSTGTGTNRLVTMGNYGSSALVNGSKYNPCLSADILGDWREEFITYNSSDPSKINIFTTATPSDYRLVTLMHDLVYREGVARENVSYNQPPHLGYYIGEGIGNVSMPDMYVAGEVLPPTLTKHGVGSSSQSVDAGAEIESFYFSWANASTVTITGLPEGISASINTAEKTVTFSGSSSVEGTYEYTVTTVSDYETQATKSGTFVIGSGVTVPDTATVGRYGSGGARNQTIIIGNSMKATIYRYTNADSLSVVGVLPEGVTATDDHNGTLTIGGTPTELGVFTYTLETKGNNVNITAVGGTITVIEDSSKTSVNFVNGDEFEVYPNPVREVSAIHISGIEGNAVITLRNAAGQIVFSKTLSDTDGGCSISKGQWPSGIYTLTIITDEKSVVKKIIIR